MSDYQDLMLEPARPIPSRSGLFKLDECADRTATSLPGHHTRILDVDGGDFANEAGELEALS